MFFCSSFGLSRSCVGENANITFDPINANVDHIFDPTLPFSLITKYTPQFIPTHLLEQSWKQS